MGYKEDAVRDVMLIRLRQNGPIRPGTFVFAVIAETGESKSKVREHLRYLTDNGLVGLDWSGNLVATEEESADV